MKNTKTTTNSEIKDVSLVEQTILGPTLSVDSCKLSCCRIGDFSKFTRDLLDIVFGSEVLGISQGSYASGKSGNNKGIQN